MNAWWQWVVTIAGGISVIVGAITAIKNMLRPLTDISNRVAKIEEHDEADFKRFRKIGEEIERNKDADRALYGAILSIMNHTIDGNHIDAMKAARNELNKHIIQKK